jgi:tetratricopeptide (TPR) repeat protein
MQVDGRADIYSLGMVAYEMLAGRRKFEDIFQDIVRDPHSEALRWMKWHSSPELSAPALSQVTPAVPANLTSIVEKMMAKDPARRYADVEALGRDIRGAFSRPTHSARRRRAREDHDFEGRMAPGDSGELALPSEGPPPVSEEALTASIPRPTMSLGRKLTYVGSVLGLALVVLVFMLVRNYSQQGMVRREAQTSYQVAFDLYRDAAKAAGRQVKQAKFTQAGNEFGRIARQFEGRAPAVVSKAEVMAWLTTAQLGVLENNSNNVDLYWSKADTKNRDIQRGKDTQRDLYNWTQEMDRELTEFRDYYQQQRDYQKKIDAVQTGLAAGNFTKALEDTEEAAKRALMTEQVNEVQELRAKIQEMQKQSEYLAHLQKADAAISENKPDVAMVEYEKALAVVESGRETLSPEGYQELKATAEKKKAELKTGIEYSKAIAEAENALTQNEMLAAADAYDKALKLKDSPEIAEKVRDIRYNYHIEQGRQHMTMGQVEVALADFNKTKEYRDTPELQSELAGAEKAKEYQNLTVQGDKLLAEKKFDEALEKYMAASKIRPGEEIVAKVADAKYAKAVYEGDQAVAAKDWAKAEAAYKRADAAKPNTPEAKARIEQVQLEKKYSDLMNQAEAARAKGNYPEALSRLAAAKNVLDKPELKEKTNLVKYEDNLQRGKQELADQNYVQALAYFKLAKSFRSTPEVDKLIEEASKKPQ